MIFQPVTVPAECSNWPLDTFLDALSFVRWYAPRFRRQR